MTDSCVVEHSIDRVLCNQLMCYDFDLQYPPSREWWLAIFLSITSLFIGMLAYVPDPPRDCINLSVS